MSSLTLTTSAPATGKSNDRVGFWTLMLVANLFLVTTFVGLLIAKLAIGRELDLADLAYAMFIASAILGVPAAWAFRQRALCLVGCELSLDPEGLTYSIGRSVYRWQWRDLESFEARRPAGLRPRMFTYPHIGILLRGESTPKRLLRMWREPRVIVDAYDMPLEDIAASLNEYRDPALHS